MSSLLEQAPKTSRMDLRMEPERKATYEEAARIKGLSLSQWTLRHLDEAAARDIEASRTISLSQEAFAELCAALDAPAPPALRDFLKKEPEWAN